MEGKPDLLDHVLSLRVVIGGGFLLLCAVVGATYYLTSAANDSEVDALEVQLEGARQSPSREQQSSAAPSGQGVEPEAAELTARIQELELEKAQLVTQLAEISLDSLSPESELGTLIQQLKADSEALRRAAITGLFELGDQRAIPQMAEYYWSDPSEATDGILVTRYMDFIWAGDREAGIEFAVKVLQGENRMYAGWAYERLTEEIYEDTFDSGSLRSALQGVALNSPDALVRTRAKLVLDRRAEYVERQRQSDAARRAEAAQESTGPLN